jgi:hypothetical protein
MYILHEWFDHEGLAFYGMFSTLEKACKAGKKVQDKGYSPMIAEVEPDDLQYLDKGGEYAFDVLYTIEGYKLKSDKKLKK